ncbi:peptidyl-glycine alpha-amidating monooxygenase B-like [Watersipora subatra]|uniref:peptidyl-glycine alpha-amidating monooxygenase B-like n=1 Tax=Watersipora subatra TaxID=2589382 RepID=UPI00355C1CB7
MKRSLVGLKMSFHHPLICLVMLLVTCDSLPSEIVREEIRMPGFRPPAEDYYVCTAVPVNEEKYIVQYEALAEASTAHHILLFGCTEPYRDTVTWECGMTCKGDDSIMFAWAKNAPPTKLPDNVGYHIGGESKIRYIVMQVHYLRVFNSSETPDRSGIAIYTTKSVPQYTQGILLLASGFGTIPPHKEAATLEVSCRFDGKKTIHPFAFRTHGHFLSRVISAYKKPTIHDEWEELGKGNPQWPQSFYPMKQEHTINPKDILAARCVYNSTNQDTVTRIGSTHKDEMCNFYMMYYVEGEAGYHTCFSNWLPKQANTLPSDSMVTLPPNPPLDQKPVGHEHHLDEHEDTTTALSFGIKIDGNELPLMAEAQDWFSPSDIHIGQLAGLDTDSRDNLVLFHRGSFTWDATSFDANQNYRHAEKGAIPEKTLIQFDSSGALINSWGDNFFYLPHGVTIDDENNMWLTDVAMHQVFKFTTNGTWQAALTLGEKFKSGSDEKHFCKPTDVAVMADGSFFISDGYCNSRIMYFDVRGHVIRVWGTFGKETPNRFNVVHSLALSETKNLLCVADRENGRIQCFNTEGKFLYEHPCDVKPFALAFLSNTDKLVVAQANQIQNTGALSLLHMLPDRANSLGDYNPMILSFKTLHDVATSHDGQSVYVAQLEPPHVYKFMMSVKESADSRIDAKALSSGPFSSHKVMPGEMSTKNGESQKVPIIVGAILLAALVIILLGMLAHKISKTRQRKDIHGAFDMGNIFSSSSRPDKTGFSPLATNEDNYSDSEDDAINERKSFVKTVN